MTSYDQYSDLDLDFNINPITGDITRKFDAEAVKRSVRNLILTQFYERHRNPTLGSNVYNLLFQPMTELTKLHMENFVKTTINNFEPRCELIQVIAKPNPGQNQYDIRIVFNVINRPEPISLDIFIKRAL